MNSVPKIAATLLAVLVLASCGKSSDEPKSGSSDVSSPSASASESLSAGPSSTANPSTGKAMAGNGYGYRLPKGWEDITAQLKQNQPGIDTGGRAKPATPPFTANMNTLNTPSKVSGEPTKDDLDALAAQIKGEVKSLAPKHPDQAERHHRGRAGGPPGGRRQQLGHEVLPRAVLRDPQEQQLRPDLRVPQERLRR